MRVDSNALYEKRILLVGGVVLLLLAGAAFVGARLLNGQGLQLPNGQTINFGFASGNAKSCEVSRILAPELPGPPLMRRAVLVRRQDHSLFIGVPVRNVNVKPNGTVSQTDGFDGPVIEVVITHDTKVYQDVTFQRYSAICGEIQQMVAPGNLDDIVGGTTFLVWGEQNDDRVLATNLVYELPLVTKHGAGK